MHLGIGQVYTFVGSPSGVVEAALAASRVAYQLIDMARHKGNNNNNGRDGNEGRCFGQRS